MKLAHHRWIILAISLWTMVNAAAQSPAPPLKCDQEWYRSACRFSQQRAAPLPPWMAWVDLRKGARGNLGSVELDLAIPTRKLRPLRKV